MLVKWLLSKGRRVVVCLDDGMDVVRSGVAACTCGLKTYQTHNTL